MNETKTFEVWNEGYAATGEHGTAQYLGRFEAENFQKACMRAMKELDWDINTYYDVVKNSFWGCRFFDNEVDARKSFG
jgi:hypothetical protein